MKQIKTLIYLFMISAIIISCSDDVANVPTDAAKSEANSAIRSLDEVINVANNAAEYFGGKSSRGIVRTAKNDVVVITNHLSRSGNQNTLLYVVNYDDDNGFAIVSARKDKIALLGIVDEGRFSEEDLNIDDGYTATFESAKSYVLLRDSLTIHKPIVMCDTFTVVEKNVLDYRSRAAKRWGQVWPEGIYCPNHMCGCVPLATVMILSYLNQPTSITLTIPEYNGQVLNIDWDAVNSHTQSEYYTAQTPPSPQNEGQQTLALLCRQIGIMEDCSYLPNPPMATSEESWWQTNYTTSTSYHAKNVLAELLPDYDVEAINYSAPYKEQIYQALRNAPCYVSGSRIGHSTGHAWVCDGYQKCEFTIKTYFGTQSAQGEILYGNLLSTDTEIHAYLHHNWGRNGKCNGWFIEDLYDYQIPAADSNGIEQGWYDSNSQSNDYTTFRNVAFIGVTAKSDN